MADLGSATPSYPGVAELTRQLDQEKIAMLSKRVDDLRNQNQELKVSTQSTHEAAVILVNYISTEVCSYPAVVF